MEEFEHNNDRLSEKELDELLGEWSAPLAPARLRAALFQEPQPWWRRFWSASVRVPAPAFCCLLIAMAALALFTSWPKQAAKPRVVTKVEKVPVPVAQEKIVEKIVTRTVYVDRRAKHPLLLPVTELRPRIIRSSRSSDVQN